MIEEVKFSKFKLKGGSEMPKSNESDDRLPIGVGGLLAGFIVLMFAKFLG